MVCTDEASEGSVCKPRRGWRIGFSPCRLLSLSVSSSVLCLMSVSSTCSRLCIPASVLFLVFPALHWFVLDLVFAVLFNLFCLLFLVFYTLDFLDRSFLKYSLPFVQSAAFRLCVLHLGLLFLVEPQRAQQCFSSGAASTGQITLDQIISIPAHIRTGLTLFHYQLQ